MSAKPEKYKTVFRWSDEKASENVGYGYMGLYNHYRITIAPVCILNYTGYKRKCVRILINRENGVLIRILYCNINMVTHRLNQVICNPDDVQWIPNKLKIDFISSTEMTEYKADLKVLVFLHSMRDKAFLILSTHNLQFLMNDIKKYVFEPYTILYVIEANIDLYTEFINSDILKYYYLKDGWYKDTPKMKQIIDDFIKKIKNT